MYSYVQAATAAVLLLAANTSYNGFPRVLFLLARSYHAPRLFLRVGDRLAFTNGIIVLSVIAAVIYVAFRGNTESLIPLYAVGVFLAFTLSQTGMVVHWWRYRDAHWHRSLLFNALGATLSAIVFVTAAVTKFTEGAWVAVLAVGLFVWMALRIRRHYDLEAEATALHPDPDEETAEKVWNELVKLQEDFLVDLEDAAIIRRDQKGRLHVTTPAHHAVTWGTLSGLFWGVLIGLIFLWPLAPVVGVAGGIMGAALGAAGDLGIKDEFRQRVQDMLQPGTSAIMVIVRKVTPDKFIEALKPYGGTVLKTSQPHAAEQQLMKALHGDDPSAPTWQQPASAGATT